MKNYKYPSWRPFGEALLAFARGEADTILTIHNPDDTVTRLPVEVFFRMPDEFPEMEWIALEACKGKVLELGAGTGAHALLLQQQGFDVIAADISPQAVEIMQSRGIAQTLCTSWQEVDGRYDTILTLMNGLGMAGELKHFRDFLRSMRRLLNPGGSLIGDSADLRKAPDSLMNTSGDYIGEITYRFTFGEYEGAPFNWLYIDDELLQQIAAEEGFTSEILMYDEDGQYLARLTRTD